MGRLPHLHRLTLDSLFVYTLHPRPRPPLLRTRVPANPSEAIMSDLRLLKLSEVIDQVNLSRAHLYNLIAQGNFPPLSSSGNSPGGAPTKSTLG